ncbi:MAG TPA: cyclic nucleotide-binding domain-containing protein [Anaerolineae bacterium]|nr:cyclic nucleotide-binding domain-containing protein [Anaerolineae bacterium]
MSEEKNPLDDLLNFGRKRRQQQAEDDTNTTGFERPIEPKKAGEKGINPLDILSLPKTQRKLITWLSRQKQATFTEIKEQLDYTDDDQLHNVLNALKQSDYIHEALLDGQIYYRMVFKGTVKRTSRGLPKQIWARVDMDNATFLQQIPMFQGLPDEWFRKMVNELQERQYRRNEVIVWQGDWNNNIYIIQNGLVGVTRLTARTNESQVIAYRNQGDIIGEFSFMTEKHQATATVTALSEVNILVMSHASFEEILREHHTATMEVMRVVTERMKENDFSMTSTYKETNISIIVAFGDEQFRTQAGTLLAGALKQFVDDPVVYTEYPDHQQLPEHFNFPADTETYQHPDQFVVYHPFASASMLPAVRRNIVLDHLSKEFTDVIISIPSQMNETSTNLLERANQIILIGTPKSWHEVRRYLNLISKTVFTQHKHIITLCATVADDTPLPRGADQRLFLPQDLPSFAQARYAAAPTSTKNLMHELALRLEHQSQVSIYLPSTVETKDGQTIDTAPWQSKTEKVLQELFSDAVTHDIREDWDSEQQLLSETVHVITSHMDQQSLHSGLEALIDYVETVKNALEQDVLAVEINHSLVLV